MFCKNFHQPVHECDLGIDLGSSFPRDILQDASNKGIDVARQEFGTGGGIRRVSQDFPSCPSQGSNFRLHHRGKQVFIKTGSKEGFHHSF